MSPGDLVSGLRELARMGLSVSDRTDLPPSLTTVVVDRARFFPSAPLPYLRRVCQCWQLRHLDFIPLDDRHRLIVGVHEALTELFGLLTSSDPLLSIPPRWPVDPSSVLTRMIFLLMEKSGGTSRPPGVLDLAGQAYFDGALCNLAAFSYVDTPLDLEGVHWEPNRPAQPTAFSVWRGFVSLWHPSPILSACVL